MAATSPASLVAVPAAARTTPIPAFDARGALPPGEHPATLAQISERYGVNPHRRAKLGALSRAVAGLGAAGIEQVYLGGSFITSKPEPGDLDLAFVWKQGADVSKVNQTIRQGGSEDVQIFAADRIVKNAQSLQNARQGWRFLDLFQHNRAGERVGILRIDTAGRNTGIGDASPADARFSVATPVAASVAA